MQCKPLANLALRPTYSFACSPFQPARAWPKAQPEAAVVLGLSSRAYLHAVNLTNWDELLLSSTTSLIVQADSTRMIIDDVIEAWALRRVTGCPLPEALRRDGWHRLHTPRGHLVLLLMRPLAVPPHLGSSLDDVSTRRPRGYTGCHPRHTLEYSAATKWYAHSALRLEALSYFDVMIKVDVDVILTVRQSPSAAELLVRQQAYWLHTASFKQVPAACDGGLAEVTRAFLKASACPPLPIADDRRLDHTHVFYSNYVAGWLGMLHSPQVLAHSEHWFAAAAGWYYRWGDQTFWTHALLVAGVPVERIIDRTTWRDERQFVHTGHAVRAGVTSSQGSGARRRPSAVDLALDARLAWSANLSAELTALYDQPGRSVHRRIHQKEHDPALAWDHGRFAMLGPVGPPCARPLEVYGEGDGEKRACGLSHLGAGCTVVSIGSNGDWSFERGVHTRTACKVHTFDCTVNDDVAVPADLRPRVTLHRVCIGERNFTTRRVYPAWRHLPERRATEVFVDWPTVLALAELGMHPPSYLKMDIEGFEYGVLRSILRAAEVGGGAALPDQIGVELHYKTRFRELSWFGRYLSAGEIALFADLLFRQGGYAITDRHDNPHCKHCTEVLLQRYQSIDARAYDRTPAPATRGDAPTSMLHPPPSPVTTSDGAPYGANASAPCCPPTAPEPGRVGRCAWRLQSYRCTHLAIMNVCPVGCGVCAVCAGHKDYGLYADVYIDRPTPARRQGHVKALVSALGTAYISEGKCWGASMMELRKRGNCRCDE